MFHRIQLSFLVWAWLRYPRAYCRLRNSWDSCEITHKAYFRRRFCECSSSLNSQSIVFILCTISCDGLYLGPHVVKFMNFNFFPVSICGVSFNSFEFWWLYFTHHRHKKYVDIPFRGIWRVRQPVLPRVAGSREFWSEFKIVITFCLLSTFTMTRGHPLSGDLRRVLIYMGTHHSFSEVMAQTGLPRTTLRTLYAEYKKHGHVLCTKSVYETRGRKRKLTTADVGVCLLLDLIFTGANLVQVPYRQSFPEKRLLFGWTSGTCF